MRKDLIERIYEAALLPEFWPDVLDELGSLSGSIGGSLFVDRPGARPRGTASAALRPAFAAYVDSPIAPRNTRISRLLTLNHPGFLRDVDYIPTEAFETEPEHHWLKSIGLGWQAGTMIPMPSGELVFLTLERRYADGPHAPQVMDQLDRVRPHLARAALIAARLGLERARSAVATLEALGLPAAVLSGATKVLAVNDLLAASPALVAGAYGHLILADRQSDALMREILVSGDDRIAATSIPIPASSDREATIAHLLLLPGAANDLMGGSVLLVLTALSSKGNVPGVSLLQGLFDLSPKEARIAAALAAGSTLKEAAASEQIRLSTARSYLENVLRKTGTRQQSQLVALLKGSRLSR